MSAAGGKVILTLEDLKGLQMQESKKILRTLLNIPRLQGEGHQYPDVESVNKRIIELCATADWVSVQQGPSNDATMEIVLRKAWQDGRILIPEAYRLYDKRTPQPPLPAAVGSSAEHGNSTNVTSKDDDEVPEPSSPLSSAEFDGFDGAGKDDGASASKGKGKAENPDIPASTGFDFPPRPSTPEIEERESSESILARYVDFTVDPSGGRPVVIVMHDLTVTWRALTRSESVAPIHLMEKLVGRIEFAGNYLLGTYITINGKSENLRFGIFHQDGTYSVEPNHPGLPVSIVDPPYEDYIGRAVNFILEPMPTTFTVQRTSSKQVLTKRARATSSKTAAAEDVINLVTDSDDDSDNGYKKKSKVGALDSEKDIKKAALILDWLKAYENERYENNTKVVDMRSKSGTTASVSVNKLLAWTPVVKEIYDLGKVPWMDEVPFEIRGKTITQKVIGNFLNHGAEWVGECVEIEDIVTKHGAGGVQVKIKVVELLQELKASGDAIGAKTLLQRLRAAAGKAAVKTK